MEILKNKKLVMILLIGLLLRLFLLGAAGLQDEALLHEGDTGTYKALGYAIAEGDWLFTEEDAKEMAYIRTPGYPLLMGIVYAFGLGDFVLALLQIVIDVGAIYIIYRLGERLGNIGWPAALLYAISPMFISFSFKLLSESLFVFVFVLANLIFFNQLKKKDEKALIVLGLIFGILILIRPIAIVFPLLYGMIYYWKTREWKTLGYLIIPAYAIAGLWVLRNVAVLNEFSFTRIGAISYACWTGPLLANDPAVDITPWQKEYEEFGLKHPDECTQKIFNKTEQAVGTVNEIAQAYPTVYLTHTIKAALLLFAPQTPNYVIDIFGQERPHLSVILFERGLDLPYILSKVSENAAYFLLLIIFSIYQLVLYGLFVLGMWNVRKFEYKVLLVLVALIALYIIVLQGPQILFSGYRYRMPMEPLLVLGAAYGLQKLIRRKKS